MLALTYLLINDGRLSGFAKFPSVLRPAEPVTAARNRSSLRAIYAKTSFLYVGILASCINPHDRTNSCINPRMHYSIFAREERYAQHIIQRLNSHMDFHACDIRYFMHVTLDTSFHGSNNVAINLIMRGEINLTKEEWNYLLRGREGLTIH